MQAPPPQKNSIIPADMVPRVQLEEKIQECLTKDETLQVFLLAISCMISPK